MNEDDTLIIQLPRAEENIMIITTDENKNVSGKNKKLRAWLNKKAPLLLHYIILVILGFLVYGICRIFWGKAWAWNGHWFRMVAVVGVSWASGVAFQSLTGLPPQLPPLIIGIIVRNIGYLDMRHFPNVEAFLRKIYPVVILGKGSLHWNYDYMRANLPQVVCLGTLPWLGEVIAMGVCMRFLLDHPWSWGLSFGSMFASVSAPVVLPTVAAITKDMPKKWPPVLISSAGIDVSLSVLGYGYLMSCMPYGAGQYVVSASVTVGVIIAGCLWGYLAGFIPHTGDLYFVELRILFILIGGFFFNCFASYMGWGSCGAAAVWFINSVAARQWVKQGWSQADNPAVTAYRVMWSACEPALFSFTGTYFVLNEATVKVMKYGIFVLLICLTVKILITVAVCYTMTLRERLFVCCAWSTKTIVQAVICPVTVLTVGFKADNDLEILYAEHYIAITILTILITTPIAFCATKYLGPILLRDSKENAGP